MCMFGVREPKRAHLRAPAFKNTTKIPREDTQRDRKKSEMVAGEGRKGEILGGPVEGGPAEGRSSVRWSGAGWSRDPNHHNNTNTARSGVEVKPRMSVTPKGVGGTKGARRVGPLGSGPLSPGLGFGYGRVWGPGLNGSLWVWGLGFLGSENLTKTLKH